MCMQMDVGMWPAIRGLLVKSHGVGKGCLEQLIVAMGDLLQKFTQMLFFLGTQGREVGHMPLRDNQ